MSVEVDDRIHIVKTEKKVRVYKLTIPIDEFGVRFRSAMLRAVIDDIKAGSDIAVAEADKIDDGLMEVDVSVSFSEYLEEVAIYVTRALAEGE